MVQLLFARHKALSVRPLNSATLLQKDRWKIYSGQGYRTAWKTAKRFETSPSPGKPGAFNRSMQHHLGTKLFKGGVYDATKTVETYSRGKDRDLASMEVWAVSARDWACFWQTTSHHSQAVVALWRHSSHRSSPFAVGTHPSGARRHLTRNRF